MAAIRNGFLILLICALPASADACGIFSPCGSPSWIGFSLAIPVPRLPHLHTFATHGCQSPMCGAGQWGVGHGGCLGQGYGACGYAPVAPITPQYQPPMITPTPLQLPPISCNPCGPALTQTMVPQQTVSYREVPQIQYRQEAYTATVPVTSYRQETRFRSVPYRTVAHIPQVSTHYVPQVTAAAPCDPCTAGISTPQYGYHTASLPYSPTPYAEQQTAGIPEYPYPAQQPQASSQEWQTVPQRQAQQGTDVQQMGYYQTVPQQPQMRTAPKSLFQPAPSAAAAWQSRWLR